MTRFGRWLRQYSALILLSLILVALSCGVGWNACVAIKKQELRDVNQRHTEIRRRSQERRLQELRDSCVNSVIELPGMIEPPSEFESVLLCKHILHIPSVVKVGPNDYLLTCTCDPEI